MQNEHWSCALANDEVTLPMAALGSGVDLLGPFVDGDAVSRRSRPARAAAFVTAREMCPSWSCLAAADGDRNSRHLRGGLLYCRIGQPSFFIAEVDQRAMEALDPTNLLSC